MAISINIYSILFSKNIQKSLILMLFFFGSFTAFGQHSDCNCISALEEISALIQHSKSYKIQIKKENREQEFQQWKEKIITEIKQDELNEYFCAGYLQKYASFIKDRHNQVFKVPEDLAENIPTYKKAIDTTKIEDDISGIYHAGRDQIFLKKESDSLWFGITLKSASEGWKKGKIRLKINETEDGSFEIFEFFANGILSYQNNIKIENGRIQGTFWNKVNQYNFHANHEQTFNFTSINTDFDYIGIKTLSRTRNLMKEAQVFYEDHLKNLTKENLIIDLRNNGGGAIKQAEPLIKSLQKNENIKHIFVMINFKTASAAELVALQLKKDKRSIIAGENSRGMLEYGYGNKSFSAKTDCLGFNVSFSTKHENNNLHQYETKGITPDLYLQNTSNWIDQIVEFSKLP
ncbi:peptidase S41 [Zunongwangia sp. SCSIO 43204]|uniref:S41 family peptidase n=1 Tax=Zunongwangia sp. SCSIO 43204 TaxID=2779359 RepID=UPI001CA9020A|nr:S41 family peptidase [Zunongwangia sp. SCSIO 43204]UAB85136.1 peptidase S41 [Zunongwangia sp. SCSIO 43204]